MNNKLSKALIKHCDACFLALKGLQNFDSYIYFEIFYINFDIII